MKYVALVLAASVGLMGSAGAQAQAPDFSRVSLAGNDGNVVGGGYRQFVSGGSEMLISDAQSGGGAGRVALPEQAGRHATIVSNDGDGPQVLYLGPAPASRGRHARIYGGGDEQVIVYGSASRMELAGR